MPADLTIEDMGKQLVELKTMVANFVANDDTDKEKEAAAKKAMDEKMEDEKKEAKKAAYNASIKIAMDEKDHDKKMAMVKKAEDEYNDKKHEAFGEPKDKKEGMDKEDKEHKAHVASMITKDKNSMIKQILTANSIVNPQNVKAIEARLKQASIMDVQKEFDIIKPFVASGVESTVPYQPTQEKIIPFYANVMSPANIDDSMLTANSEDSEFINLTEADFQKLENGY